MRHAPRICLASLLMLVASGASASFHTFKIDLIFSNADGTVQYVVLLESQGMDGQNMLGGHAFTSTHAGTMKSYTFSKNLPGGTSGYYGTPSPTADKRVLIGTQGFAALGLVPPDYIIPDGFLATDGGTVNFADVDQVPYASLPTDGVSALDRSGATIPNSATNFAGQVAAVPAMPVTAVEYYNATLDHYFISALQPDIDALDSGRISGWSRTGQSFKVYSSQAGPGAATNPVCRFYIPPQHGNSHFFSASPAECTTILQKTPTDPNYSGYTYESPSAFYIALPDTMTGACPVGTRAAYRLWNQRADSNHRYTTDPAVKAAMVAKGYVAEGYGPDAAIMCATL